MAHSDAPKPTTIDEESRRAFLALATGVLSLIIALLMAVPLVGFVLAPVFRRPKERWVKLGPLDAVKSRDPVKMVYSFPTVDAWLSKVRRGTVYLVPDKKNELIVLSNICTHAGCGVRWSPQSNSFQCPCHNGRFDRYGRVIEGPPPEPLHRFKHKVEDGTVFIQIEEV